MTSAITFALISLAAAGCLDDLQEIFPQGEVVRHVCVRLRGRGFSSAPLCGSIGTISIDETTLWYGLFTGALVALANILLIESLTGLDVSLAR